MATCIHHSQEALISQDEANLFWWKRGLIQAPRQVVQWDHVEDDRPSRGIAEKNRKVSWSELFLDLVLVTNVSLFADAYASATLTMVEVALLYRSLYNCWWVTTLYAGRFHVDDLIQKTTVGILMLLLLFAGLKISNGGSFAVTAHLLCGSVSAFHVVMILSYLRIFLSLPLTRKNMVNNSLLPGLIQAFGHFFCLFIYNETFLLFIIGALALIDIVWHTISYNFFRLPKKFQIPVHIDHMVERRGCLRLIVFGEVIFGVSVSPDVVNAKSLGLIALAYSSILSMKLLAFDVDIIPPSRHTFHTGYIRPLIWLEATFFFDLSMILLGATSKIVLTGLLTSQYDDDDDLRHANEAHLVLCLCVGMGILMLTIERLMHDHSHILGKYHFINQWGTTTNRKRNIYSKQQNDIATSPLLQIATTQDNNEHYDSIPSQLQHEEEEEEQNIHPLAKNIFWFQIVTHFIIVLLCIFLAFFCHHIHSHRHFEYTLVLISLSIMLYLTVIINLLDEVATMADVGANKK